MGDTTECPLEIWLNNQIDKKEFPFYIREEDKRRFGDALWVKLRDRVKHHLSRYEGRGAQYTVTYEGPEDGGHIKIDYSSLPLRGPLPSKESMERTSAVLKKISDEFIPTWQKSKVELGTAYSDGKLHIVVGVPFQYIEEIKLLLKEYNDSGVSIVIHKEELPSLKHLDVEMKPWWKLW